MSGMTLIILIVIVIAFLFLLINLVFAPHNPDQEKNSDFECGFHSFKGQNRVPFNISFFIFGIVYLVFDCELLLLFPFALSADMIESYGTIMAVIFALLVFCGFSGEIGKGAFEINSRQDINKFKKQDSFNVTTLGSISTTGIRNYSTSSSSSSSSSGGGGGGGGRGMRFGW